MIDSWYPHATLSDEESLSCHDGALSINECLDALKSMTPNKSPGSDDPTSNFYISFWRGGGDSIRPLGYRLDQLWFY